MGIGLTLQQVEGWEGQFDRMVRFYDRACSAARQNNGEDEIDFSLVVFQQALSLRDWVKEACPSVSSQLENLFRDHLEMKFCRDLANGFKHMTIRSPSIDRSFSIVFEYNPRGGRKGDMVVLGDGHEFVLLELAGKCVDLWREFIETNQLLPSSVVARK